MKLKDWADKQGISYLTAWRWFTAGDSRLANAYQSDSGTIIVPDDSDSLETTMSNVQDSDIMAAVLKKTVEFSKNQYAIEDFTAWLLSNFTLRLKYEPETKGPKYSRVKPKSEEVQNHFKQFLKPKGEKPKPNMFVTTDAAALDELMDKSDDLTAKELVEQIHKIGAEAGATVNPTDAPEVEDLMKDLSSALSEPPNIGSFVFSESGRPIVINGVTTYGETAGGIVNRSVDLTPQPIDYTGSTYAFSSSSLSPTAASMCSSVATTNSLSLADAAGVPAQPASGFIKYGDQPQTNYLAFQPTAKEVESAARISSVAVEKPRRGRKSLKGKK